MLGVEPEAVVAAGQAKHLDAHRVDQPSGTENANNPIGRQQGFKESGHGLHSKAVGCGFSNYRWDSKLGPDNRSVKPPAEAAGWGGNAGCQKNLAKLCPQGVNSSRPIGRPSGRQGFFRPSEGQKPRLTKGPRHARVYMLAAGGPPPAGPTVFLFSLQPRRRREHPMRTYTNTSFTNRTVFGSSQDRVVVSSSGTCAHAAQHLTLWHAAKRDRDTDRRA